MWKKESSAPFDRNVQLAVLDEDGMHALIFPCRRIVGGWMNADTKQRIRLCPTHWREWEEANLTVDVAA